MEKWIPVNNKFDTVSQETEAERRLASTTDDQEHQNT